MDNLIVPNEEAVFFDDVLKVKSCRDFYNKNNNVACTF